MDSINTNYFLSIDSFNNHFKNFNVKSLNIISVNIRSISSIRKFNTFKSLINEFDVLPDVIAIQETWIQTNLETIYHIPGYNNVHCCRKDGYGGTSLYIKTQLQFVIEEVKSCQYIECIRISLENVKISGKPIKITTFYRSPKCDIGTFCMFIEQQLQVNSQFPSLIVGDSNVDFLNSSSDDVSNIICHYDFCNCHYLITRPTSKTSIDNTFSNLSNKMSVNSIECSMSDHNIVSTVIFLNIERSAIISKFYRICNFNVLRENLTNHINNGRINGNSNENMDEFINAFSNCIKGATTEREYKKPTKKCITPWVNHNLESLMQLKRSLLAKRRKKGNHYNLENQLKQISKIVKKANKICMNRFYQEKLQNLQHNPKKSWEFLNEHLGRSEKPEIKLKNVNGDFVMDSKIKCDLFNEYFLNVPTMLKRNITQIQGDDDKLLSIMKQCQQRFRFNNITGNEIILQVSSLQTNKSPGCDDISARALKECCEIIYERLTDFFNSMVNNSLYPESLKISKIIPIPKERNVHTVDKYRPIALLPLIDKVFEKILHKQISDFLEETKQIYKFQYGFRKGSGTQEAVVNVVNIICEGLDAGFGGVAGIFYDLSKAFDLVDHEILIQKLEFYGLQASAIHLIRSYLQGRKQYVQIENSTSSVGLVKYGVPQGSVLGPLLFTLYINDISNLNLNGKLVMYADDISLFYPYHHDVILKAQIEHDATLILEYVRINKLQLNAEKTKLIRFKPYSTRTCNDFNVIIGANIVQESFSLQYLGVQLQSNLNWNMHIQQIKSKVAPAVGILYKFKHKFDVCTKLLIYNNLINSHFNYMMITYGCRKSVEFRSLQRVQNKALKTVYNLPAIYPSLNLYSNICKNILPLHGIYKMQILLYMYKSLHNIGHHTIEFTRNQTNVNTRNNMNLRLKRCRLETTKQRIEYTGCYEYNQLSQNLKDITRISVFKTSIKSQLLQNIEMHLL